MHNQFVNLNITSLVDSGPVLVWLCDRNVRQGFATVVIIFGGEHTLISKAFHIGMVQSSSAVHVLQNKKDSLW